MMVDVAPFIGAGQDLPCFSSLDMLHSLSIDVLLANGMTIEDKLWLIGMLVHRDESKGSHQAFYRTIGSHDQRWSVERGFLKFFSLVKFSGGPCVLGRIC